MVYGINNAQINDIPANRRMEELSGGIIGEGERAKIAQTKEEEKRIVGE